MANLLIVDDELSMRQFLTHLFQREGHTVRVAENGRKAMELLRIQPSDVIVSDVKMPDIGGIELLRAARELHPNVEVILMTAFANESTAHEAFLLGAFDFVHKPFDNELLKEKVARALGKISARSRSANAERRERSADQRPTRAGPSEQHHWPIGSNAGRVSNDRNGRPSSFDCAAHRRIRNRQRTRRPSNPRSEPARAKALRVSQLRRVYRNFA